MNFTLHQGNCVDVMRAMPADSVDSIVTDPPYELGFMGKSWDASGIANSVEMWTEALRVLKPGGHLLAFSGSRTYHRMTCAIEDAGFEVRDQIMWVYGSGFPKSLDVSKAIDKAAGAEREVVGVHERSNLRKDGAGFRNLEGLTESRGAIELTAPATDAARQWQGWGTALKPAHEPICVARKPLIGTVAANVLQHGTGALNIDECRVDVTDASYAKNCSGDRGHAGTREGDEAGSTNIRAGGGSAASGRWPANLIHDGSDQVVALFPTEAGAVAPVTVRNGDKFRGTYGAFAGNVDEEGSTFQGDKGSAARFFYCAKASRADRNEGMDDPGPQFTRGSTLRDAENLGDGRKGNHHPTVKPTDLMRYLCRLVTPADGLVLDPFMGSGSTGRAAMLEGFQFIGIDLSHEYVEIARARITHARRIATEAANEAALNLAQGDLFQEAACN